MPLSDLSAAFDRIAHSLPQAARERSAGLASHAAKQEGLIELGDGSPSQHHIWERRDGEIALRFEWRWYDQSKAFSIQPDMNILSIELRQGDSLLKGASDRYED